MKGEAETTRVMTLLTHMESLLFGNVRVSVSVDDCDNWALPMEVGSLEVI